MYAELVCGTPGSGKTTYCEGKRQYIDAVHGNADRLVLHVNLDPGNDEGIFPYPCAVDVCDLIRQRQVMEREHLGPNGSYLFCAEFLEGRMDWLKNAIVLAVAAARGSASGGATPVSSQRSQWPRGPVVPPAGAQTGPAVDRRPVWLLIDCPGQVEFYINCGAMKALVTMLRKELRCDGICMTHLCDASVACRDVSQYVSTCLLCLTCMVDVELPHVNVLSKWDLAEEVCPLGRHVVGRGIPPPHTSSSGDHQRDVAGEDVDGLEVFLDTTAFLEEHFDRQWNAHNELAGRRRQATVSHRRMAHAADEGGDEVNEVGDDDEPAAVKRQQRHRRELARSMLDVVSGYSLVGFVPLDVNDVSSMKALAERVDSAAGFFGVT